MDSAAAGGSSAVIEEIMNAAAVIFGAVVLVGMVVLALCKPNPTPFQQGVFRTVLALASAGFGAAIPGLINFNFNPGVGVAVSAGQALALFGIIYFLNPARVAADSALAVAPTEQGIRLSTAERAIIQRHIDLINGAISRRDPRYLPSALGLQMKQLADLYQKLLS
jgi:hypothetical protein